MSDDRRPTKPTRLGEWYEERGDLAAAEDAYRRALEDETEDADWAGIELGRLLLARGVLEEAQHRLETAAASTRTGFVADRANWYLGLLLFLQGEKANLVEGMRRSKGTRSRTWITPS